MRKGTSGFESGGDSEKERIWVEKADEVEHIVDGLGLPVDDGIKEAVTAFRVLDFPTRGSCEGHPEEEHGENYPWIEVGGDGPEDWKEDETKMYQWLAETMRYREEVQALLDEFYVSRTTPDELKLGWKNHGIGAFRVESVGAEGLSDEEQKARYKWYREEMDAFTEFLKGKFFLEEVDTPEDLEPAIDRLLSKLDGYDFNTLSPEDQEHWYFAEMEANVGMDREAAREHLEDFLDYLRSRQEKGS